jgi:hypothetical protein
VCSGNGLNIDQLTKTELTWRQDLLQGGVEGHQGLPTWVRLQDFDRVEGQHLSHHLQDGIMFRLG